MSGSDSKNPRSDKIIREDDDMDQLEGWFRGKQVERTIESLKKNNFEAVFVSDAKAAVEEILKRIPQGATVGVGGSMTLTQIGIFAAFESNNIPYSPRQAKNMEERTEMSRKALAADVFLSSTNALTEDGKLFNVDATGNRVGGMFFGPKKVIVVTGVNKIVKDLDAAEKRVKEWVAPQNAKRLGRKTPCAETGVCADCRSPERICNIYVALGKKPSRTEVVVILVGENLGL
jgi:L-lactate utilization protein LutB